MSNSIPSTKQTERADETEVPRAIVHKQILDVAEARPEASMKTIADEVTGASLSIVERVLEEYGDPADADGDETDDESDAAPDDTAAKSDGATDDTTESVTADPASDAATDAAAAAVAESTTEQMPNHWTRPRLPRARPNSHRKANPGPPNRRSMTASRTGLPTFPRL